MSVLLSTPRLLTPDGDASPGWVLLDGDRITDVGEGPPPRRADHALTGTLVPGFVDAHVHGGGGASYDAGDVDEAATVAATHAAAGTTTVMASLVSAAPSELAATMERLAPLVTGGLLAGIHLEGPWLSRRHRGAHDRSALTLPTPADVDRLLDVGRETLRMVTLAPELPGALDAVRRLADSGVVAAVGHTDAAYAQTRAALDAGARAGTHVFNGMRGVHHREPGPVTALLEPAANDCWLELVADGVHLHPAMLRAVAAAAPDRVVLVSDAMAAAGASDGDYRLGALEVTVRDGVARLASGSGSGAIAGSTLTMAAAVRHAVQQAGWPLALAVRAATAHPARMLGLDGSNGPRLPVGSIEPGFAADLVVLDDDLHVDRVMRDGAWLIG